METNVKLFERVRAAMVETGHTQETLAKTIGIGKSTFNAKLNGKRDFTLPECIRIAKATNKTLDDIFFANEIPKTGRKKAI